MTRKCIKQMWLATSLLSVSALVGGCERGLPQNATVDIVTPTERLYGPAQIVDVSTQGLLLTLDGLAPTNSAVQLVSTDSQKVTALATAGDEIGQDVNWRAELEIPPMTGQTAVDKYSLITRLPDDVEAISPEHIIVLRKRPELGTGPHQQAVILSRPGAASMVMDNPFEPLTSKQGLRLVSIDYDDNGSVIFSGRSALRGRIRIYVNGDAIGETGLGEGGTWFIIAGWTLPVGTYPIEIHRIGVDPRLPGFQTSIFGAVLPSTNLASAAPVTLDKLAIAFERRDPKDSAQTAVIDFTAAPSMWKYRYDIPGGGQQYTVIYGAGAQIKIEAPSPPDENAGSDGSEEPED